MSTEGQLITKKIQNFQNYYLLNKAHLGTLATKIFVSTYIESKFLYHLISWDYPAPSKRLELEGAYNHAIKNAFKFPQYADNKSLYEFYGFKTIEEWNAYNNERIENKWNMHPKPIETYSEDPETLYNIM